MKKFFCFTVIFCGFFIANSCSDDLEIQNNYEFAVTHLPVPKRLKMGETAEIRFELIRSGNFVNAKYYVRYFQPDGSGILTLDAQILKPNDGYQLKKEIFRMYYTSGCEEQQVIDLTFYDNFKNQVDISFSFSNDRIDKDE